MASAFNKEHSKYKSYPSSTLLSQSGRTIELCYNQLSTPSVTIKKKSKTTLPIVLKFLSYIVRQEYRGKKIKYSSTALVIPASFN